MRIDVYSHFFKVTKYTPRILGILFKFSARYTHQSFIQRQQGPNTAEPKTYAIKTKDDKEFRFHIGQLEPFLLFLKNDFIDDSMIDRHDHELYIPQKADFKLVDSYKLYDYQQEASDFIVQNDSTDFHTRLATLATGLGKGVVSLASVARIGEKILVVVLSKYTEKWAIEVAQKLTVKPKEIMIVQGSDQLKGIIQAAKDDKKAVVTCTIISLTTLQNYFKAYEDHPHIAPFDEYPCTPEELCETLGIGSVIIDEVHEHLYGVFKFFAYTNVPKVICLSGTVISQDPFIEKIHKLMFPAEIRFLGQAMKKYIGVYAISYGFRDIQGARIKTTEFGSRNYSQVAYEKSLMKHPGILNNYFKLIEQLIEIGYLKDYKTGDKLAIYAGSIAMCTALTEHLKKRYSNLDVRRYCENDKFEDVLISDIRITTILSAGTAIDIPQLTSVILTVSVNSAVANLQVLGRLREIQGRDVKFIYMYCDQIPKQIDYHNNRKALYSDRAAFIKEFKSPLSL